MSVEQNIEARLRLTEAGNLAGEFVNMGIEFAAESGLVDEPFRHFWACVLQLGANLVDEKLLCAECTNPAVERTDNSNPERLNDDSPFPFGKYKGKRCGDVPDDYLRWMMKQEWSKHWPDVEEYANLIVTGKE